MMNSYFCHSGVDWNLTTPIKKIPTFVGMTLLFLLFFSPAIAKDKKLEQVLEEANPKPAGYYSPEFCDFEITFPEAPYQAKRCPAGTNKCYNIKSYMMVYDLQTTVEVSASCTPSSPENYAQYNEAVIKAALSGMVNRVDIDDFQITTVEQENVRQGSLLGTGTYGKQGRILNAQLWIGQNSILTIDAKLTGAENATADEVFGDILASVGVKDQKTPK